MNTATQTLDGWARDAGLSIVAEEVSSRPDGFGMGGDGWTHYHVRLATVEHPDGVRTFWSQGPAHTAPPTAVDVLEALLSDYAMGAGCRDMWDMAAEFGMPATADEGRTLERTWHTLRRVQSDLLVWLGAPTLDTLLQLERN